MHTTTPHHALITRLRTLIGRGAYHEVAAAAALVPPATRHDPAVALPLVRAALLQGAMARAERLLDAVDVAGAEPGVALILALEGAALRVFRHADFPGALAAAADAFTAAPVGAISAAEQAEAERVHLRIRLTAVTYYGLEQAERTAALARLPTLATTLAAAGWVAQAFAARLTHAEQQPNPQARLALLAAVATDAAAAERPGIAAEALVNRAGVLVGLGAPQAEVEAALAQAAAYYTAIDHQVGLIDIAHLRARHAIEQEHAAPTRWEETLAAYRAVGYHRGIFNALLDLSHLAHQRGDVAGAIRYRQQLVAHAAAVGMGLLRESQETALIDLYLRNLNIGAAIETAQAALATQPTPFMAAGFEQLLATAYSFVDDTSAALHHIRRALAGYEALGVTASASEAVLLLASYLNAQRQDGAWAEAETLLQHWEARDDEAGATEALLSKRELRVQLRINRYLYSSTDRGTDRGNDRLLAEAEALLALALPLTAQLRGVARVRRAGALHQMQGQVAQLRADEAGVHAAWEAARACYVAGGLAMEAANCDYILGVLHLNRANQELQPHFGLAERHLRAALTYYDEAYMRGQAADTRFMFAQLYTNASLAVTAPLRDDLLDAALDHLTLAEADFDAIRREYGVGTVLAAQQGKRALIAKSRRIYTLALTIVTLHRRDTGAAWQWTQRAKARALTDALGAGTVTPARILAPLAAHPVAAALVAEEQALVAALEQAEPAAVPAQRARLAELYTRMMAEEALADYLELRHGLPLLPADLTELVDSAQRIDGEVEPCLFIDWIAVDDRLFFLALRPGEEPYLERMGTPVSQVARFVQEHLNPRTFRLTLRDQPDLLRELDALITPLGFVSRPGDLLVLSPSGPLHALPLHALELDSTPLIARNPVVYTPSLSVLRHTVARGNRRGTLRSAALFGDPSADTESAADLVNQLGQELEAAAVPTVAYLRDQVTRATFAAAAPGRDLLYFHGHARHDAADPLASHLQLADGPFRAADIFGLRDLSAELVILAACESAAAVIATGDEPLGLIPAFLYAGGRSVIAGQWRIQRRAAARWLHHFFEALFVPPGVENGGEPLTFQCNKAQAHQQATLALRNDPAFAAPYYWAPFVLYGDWR